MALFIFIGSVGDVIFNMALALPWEECISRWLLYCNHIHTPTDVRRPKWRAAGMEGKRRRWGTDREEWLSSRTEIQGGWRRGGRIRWEQLKRGKRGYGWTGGGGTVKVQCRLTWQLCLLFDFDQAEMGNARWSRGSCCMLKSWSEPYRGGMCV